MAQERAQILRWLREVPGQIRHAGRVRLALKLMNARFDDDFQLQMLQAANSADTLTVFNRLWDADAGVAFGGHELSQRNLRVLAEARVRRQSLPPLSGTGNIHSGRLILEYAGLGCESVQLHTFFQLPLSQYPATDGSRTQRALHVLVFHPTEGLIAGLLDLENAGTLERTDGELRFLDVPAGSHANSSPRA